MTEQKKALVIGSLLLAGFAVILGLIFSPIYKGHNLITYLDQLFNSISKGSVYYIPKLQEDAAKFQTSRVEVTLKTESESQLREIADLFRSSAADVKTSGAELTIKGDLASIITACLNDADHLFNNQGEALAAKYGYSGKKVLYNWWLALKMLDKDLTRQKQFAEAKFVSTVLNKAVECSYNYFQIIPLNISDEIIRVTLSLVFYVVYTIWLGFAILFTLMGLGFKLEH